MIPAPPTSTLFPYTTLFRSKSDDKQQRPRPQAEGSMQVEIEFGRAAAATNLPCGLPPLPIAAAVDTYRRARLTIDRKSTRLNSSHVRISYAVFCLKKKSLRRLACDDRRAVFVRISLQPHSLAHSRPFAAA